MATKEELIQLRKDILSVMEKGWECDQSADYEGLIQAKKEYDALVERMPESDMETLTLDYEESFNIWVGLFYPQRLCESDLFDSYDMDAIEESFSNQP